MLTALQAANSKRLSSNFLLNITEPGILEGGLGFSSFLGFCVILLTSATFALQLEILGLSAYKSIAISHLTT